MRRFRGIRLLLLVAAALFALGAPQPASASNGATRGINVFAPFLFTPTCSGAETIYFAQAYEPWTGLFKATATHSHFSGHLRLYGTGGVGLNTGATYHFDTGLVQVSQGGGPTGALGTLFLSHTTLIQDHAGRAYQVQMLFHFRATPSGVVQSVNKVSWSCGGAPSATGRT